MSLRHLVYASLLFGFSSVSLQVSASEAGKSPDEPLPTLEDVEFDYRGDAKQGETLSVQCVACHGQNGNSIAPTWPKLAGQHASYIYKQLQNMRGSEEEAARYVPQMSAIVAGLSNQDMADLAAYFEQQTGTVEGAQPELLELGEQIYRHGMAETGVPACTSCHQPDGAGVGLSGYPKLAGQYAQYTTQQLQGFRAAARDDLNAPYYRKNDGETMIMRLSAKGLTDKQILAVSEYVSGLMSKRPELVAKDGASEAKDGATQVSQEDEADSGEQAESAEEQSIEGTQADPEKPLNDTVEVNDAKVDEPEAK